MITKEYLRALYINFMSNITNAHCYEGHGECPTHVSVNVKCINNNFVFMDKIVGLSFISSSGKEIVEDSNFDTTDDFYPVFYEVNREGYIYILGINLESIASVEFVEYIK